MRRLSILPHPPSGDDSPRHAYRARKEELVLNTPSIFGIMCQLFIHCELFMQITVEIPDALAGQLHLGAKADLRTLLQALVRQRVAEGGYAVVQVDEDLKVNTGKVQIHSGEHQANGRTTARPQRDVLGRLRNIYGDLPLSGENAVLVARASERY